MSETAANKSWPKTWLARLTGGLNKTAETLQHGFKRAVGLGTKLAATTLAELEAELLNADVGPAQTAALLQELPHLLREPFAAADLQTALATLITQKLTPLEQPFSLTNGVTPKIIVVAGVNGAGKTTTIGKLAAQWSQQGHRVMVAAADTFRAGAVAQLAVWAERANAAGGVSIEGPQKPGEDPAGVAFRAVQRAQTEGHAVVLIDTAGRLPNRQDLMAELAKIQRVLRKLDATAPHHTLLVLDGTQGQAVLPQVASFTQALDLTPARDGLIVTKLDGSAKAGFLLSLAAQAHPLPVCYLGVGEQLNDLGPFTAQGFATALVGTVDSANETP